MECHRDGAWTKLGLRLGSIGVRSRQSAGDDGPRAGPRRVRVATGEVGDEVTGTQSTQESLGGATSESIFPSGTLGPRLEVGLGPSCPVPRRDLYPGRLEEKSRHGISRQGQWGKRGHRRGPTRGCDTPPVSVVETGIHLPSWTKCT